MSGTNGGIEVYRGIVTEAADLINRNDWFVLWRIVFSGRPEVLQEITLWGNVNPLPGAADRRPKRLARRNVYLSPLNPLDDQLLQLNSLPSETWLQDMVKINPAVKGLLDSGEFTADADMKSLRDKVRGGRVTFNGGHASFDNYYLMYHTVNLQAEFLNDVNRDLRRRGLHHVFELDAIAQSVPLPPKKSGDNIRLSASVRLGKSQDGETLAANDYPLFYLRQPNPGQAVSFRESREGRERTLSFAISGFSYEKDWNHGRRDWHKLLVRQDKDKQEDIKEQKHYFETVIDGMPLESEEIPTGKENHTFSYEGNLFYIGGAPREDGSIEKFTGDIDYLELDPNDSCGTCAM